ncbi:SufE family protein [Catenovulum maritimum]|uniref:Fe-S metabolism associated domain-containing protein n=1 Tax=Catenovulum maritimum TaxID=1513271 RepID=A0A0J8GR09_9ALTE|nr:SufE family protein [Catenovulum maritimum]KMT65265.1 hypothetical protein XM47_09495 [Catenovulum maritimum]
MTQLYSEQAQSLIDFFQQQNGWEYRYRHLMKLAAKLEKIAPENLSDDKKIDGCETNVWMQFDCSNTFNFTANCEARIMSGILYLLQAALNQQTLQYVSEFNLSIYLNQLGLANHFSESRTNGLKSIEAQIKKHAIR